MKCCWGFLPFPHLSHFFSSEKTFETIIRDVFFNKIIFLLVLLLLIFYSMYTR